MIVCLDFLNTYEDGKRTIIKSLVRCDDCGKERIIRKGSAKRGVGVSFCASCCTKGEKSYNYGKHYSLERCKKISEAQKGGKGNNYGKKASEETRKKMSEARSGEKNAMFGRYGKDAGFYGKHHTKEHLEKIRLSHLGNKNPMWRDDLTQQERENNKNRNYNPKTLEWRNKVFKRDDYIDQITGRKGGELVAHHLYNYANYPELRFDMNNGITISKDLHILFHMIFGIKNNTPSQFKQFEKYILDILS